MQMTFLINYFSEYDDSETDLGKFLDEIRVAFKTEHDKQVENRVKQSRTIDIEQDAHNAAAKSEEKKSNLNDEQTKVFI